jgi:hypothetical protein
MSVALRLVETQERKDQLREMAASARLHGWTLRSVVAIAGLAGGGVAVGCGSIMTAISWIVGDAASLHRYGTLLLLLTIPLFIVGAHFLDLQEAASKRKRKHEESQDQ